MAIDVYKRQAKDPSIVKATTEYVVTIHASVAAGVLAYEIVRQRMM